MLTASMNALHAPADPLPVMPGPRVFADQTVRQYVHLAAGGEQGRLELSNEFGDGALVLEGVQIGPAVDASDAWPVRLAGRERWEIAPGTTALSDPVRLPDTRRVSITIYVREPTGPATYLHSAQRTAQIAAGDQLGKEMAPSETSTSAFWLARVLVDATPSGPVIVALGDSITRGDGTTVDQEQRYPDHLQRRLGPVAVVLNAGIGGNRLLHPRVGPSLLDRLERDVLRHDGATHVIVMAGLNDLALPAFFGGVRPTAEELYAALVLAAERSAAGGVPPFLATITPFGAATFAAFRTDGNEEIRAAVNERLRTQSAWPVLDFATAVADPRDPSRLHTDYDSGDGVHLNDAGAAALADAVDLTAFARYYSGRSRSSASTIV